MRLENPEKYEAEQAADRAKAEQAAAKVAAKVTSSLCPHTNESNPSQKNF